jgi:hypothetical protein
MRNYIATLLIVAGMLLLAWMTMAPAQPTNLMPFETNVIVGTTAVMAAVPPNPSRKGLLLCNAAASGTIWVTFGKIIPQANVGVPLAGGAVINSCLNLMPYLGPSIAMGAQINAIASAASTQLVALEF